MITVNETISSRDVEFDTYEEMKAFVKGLRYEFVEHIDVSAIAYHDAPKRPNTDNGKYIVSLEFEPRKGTPSLDRLSRMNI